MNATLGLLLRLAVILTVAVTSVVAGVLGLTSLSDGRSTSTDGGVDVEAGLPSTLAPIRGGTDRVVCSHSAKVLAFRGPKVYYPPTYPPTSIPHRSDGVCFKSVQHAEVSGFRLAPSPVNVTRDGDIYFVGSSAELLLDCRSAAARLGFLVACPRQLPASIGQHRCGGDGCTWGTGFLLDASGFLVPDGYRGVDGRAVPHLLIEAGPSINDGECRPAEAAGGPAHMERVECSPVAGLHAGHMGFRWTKDAVQYFVSIHGVDPRNAVIVERVAASIQLIGPSAP